MDIIDLNKSIPIRYLKDIEIIIEILKKYNTKEIYLFGSLVNGNYGKNSDIDIAIRGLEPSVF